MQPSTVSNSEGMRERKKRQTHHRISRAARHLFIGQGYANTTIEAIAEKADISKPTFFNYYPSKLAVLHQLLDEMDDRFVEYIADELKKDCSSADRLRNILLRSATFINESPQLARLILIEGLGAIDNTDKASARFKKMHDAMALLIRDGIARKEIRTDYSVELLVQILAGGYLHALLNWLCSQDYNLISHMKETARFLAESLSPPTNSLVVPGNPSQ